MWVDIVSPVGVLWVLRSRACNFSQAKDVGPLEARQRLPSVFSASCSSVVDPKRSGERQVVMVIGSCQGGWLVVLFFGGVVWGWLILKTALVTIGVMTPVTCFSGQWGPMKKGAP